MAIEVTKMEKQPGDGIDEYQIQAFADDKTDVVEGATFKNLPVGAKIQPGSSIVTANGEIAFRKSDGAWNWV